MLKTSISVTTMAAVLLFNTSFAETPSDSQYAITGKVGTLGLGADLTYRINNKINARFNFNGGSVDADGEEDGINYTGNLEAQTIGGLVDYHPMASGLRISAGLYSNGNELDLNANGGNAQIGDTNYDLSNTNLNTNVSFKSVAPYLGLGWGNAVKMGSKWRFALDAGVLFQGSPNAKITVTGNNANVSQADINEEEQNLNDDLKDFKAYPVISAGVSYRF